MSQVPTAAALRRLARDVRALRHDSLADHGVHYCHSETNVLKGQAVVLGGASTPYEAGCYVFGFEFPADYPHRPPVVTFLTHDQDRTRFNPNLYRNGKVCLSILNTWQGPQWTGCQTISSILLSIRSNILGVKHALLNEPGVTPSHRDFDRYHEILEFKNKQIAVWGCAQRVASQGGSGLVQVGDIAPGLQPIVARHFLKVLPSLASKLPSLASRAPPRVVSTGIYDMQVTIDWKKLEGSVRGGIATVTERLQELAQIDV